MLLVVLGAASGGDGVEVGSEWSQGRAYEADGCSWSGGVVVGVGEVESSPVGRTGGVEVKVQEAPALLRWIRERSDFRE